MIPCIPVDARGGPVSAWGGDPLRDRAAAESLLARWVERGWLRTLDAAFAGLLWREVPDADPRVILAAALASHQLGRGHVCLDLHATLDNPAFALSLPPEGGAAGGSVRDLRGEVFRGLTAEAWRTVLKQSEELVADHAPGGEHTSDSRPLVLVGLRVYLRRYWDYEQRVAEGVRARLDASSAIAAQLPLDTTRKLLDVLFPAPEAEAVTTDWQRVACALAARSAFGIITGGPGTGKTTTVVKLLALLQALALGAAGGDDAAGAGASIHAARPLRIRLAAPTGKAAARLNESIANAIARLPFEALERSVVSGTNRAVEPDRGENADARLAARLRASIPTRVTTLHRLLGSRPGSRRFRHDARNPLALDVLVIDEASMVDLEMMAAVLAALPAGGRLILLGDKDQLASVEAGSVLGELCHRAEAGHYAHDTADWLTRACAAALPPGLIDTDGDRLDQGIAMLRTSFRFDAASGIGRLATAVNAGDTAHALAVLAEGAGDLRRERIDESAHAAFRAMVLEGETSEVAPRSTGDRGADLGVDSGPESGQDSGQDSGLDSEPEAALQSTVEPASVLATEAAASAGPAEVPPRHGYRHYLETLLRSRPAAEAPLAEFDAWASRVLRAHRGFQVLCALRTGPWGVEGLNQRIATVLHQAGLIQETQGWYLGRPVLVTQNDYTLGLMNGDVGITLARPDPNGGEWKLRVAFEAGDGSGAIKWVLPSRLQAVDTVFALTVHKSQGSEFEHAALALPERASPILTRELLYTGITRARSYLTLITPAGDDLLDEVIRRRVLRSSGLLAALRGEA